MIKPKKNLSKRQIVLAVTLVLVMVLSFFGGVMYVKAQSGSFTPPNIALDDLPSSANFVIKTSGQGWYWATAGNGTICFTSTDAGALINELPTGSSISVSSGTFYVSSAILVSSYESIIGQGASTIFMGTSALGLNPVFQVEGTKSSPLTGITLSDFTINGASMSRSSYATSSKGINGDFISNSLFSNLFIENTPATGFGVDCENGCTDTSIVVQNCGTAGEVGGGIGSNGIGIGVGGWATEEPCYITNCKVINCVNAGFTFELQNDAGYSENTSMYSMSNDVAIGCYRGFVIVGTNYVTITNCQAWDCQNYGFYIRQYGSPITVDSNDVAVSNCLAVSCGSVGFEFYGCQNPAISNSEADNCTEGIVFDTGVTQGIANADHVYHSLENGINLNSADNCIVSNCICLDNGIANIIGDEVGICNQNGAYNNIEGNTCFDNQTTHTQLIGICVIGSAYTAITGNTLWSGTYDIQLQSSTTGVTVTDNSFDTLSDQTTGTIYQNNIINGRICQITGTVTISSGSSATATFNLAGTPVVSLTPDFSTTTIPYPSTISATGFTANGAIGTYTYTATYTP